MNYLAGPRYDHDLEDHSECLHGILQWFGFQDTEGDDSDEPPPAPPKHGVAVGCGVHPQLSPNFALSELTRSNKAMSLGLPNNPPCEAQKNLAAVVNSVLQPIRNHFGRPVKVTSGYRSPDVNKAVGGVSSSQHTKGQAVDFYVVGVDNLQVAEWLVRSGLVFDQLILEHYEKQGNSGWIHVSFKRKGHGDNRRQVLTKRSKKFGGKYHDGLVPFPDMGDPLKETVREVVEEPLNWVGIGAVAAGLGALWFMRKEKTGAPVSDDDKKAKAEVQGAFWGRLLGVFAATIGIGAGGVYTATEHNQKEAEMREALLEFRMSQFINEKLRPSINAQLKKNKEDLFAELDDALDAEFSALDKQCRDAIISAETALRVTERMYGQRTIIRERERVESEEEETARPRPVDDDRFLPFVEEGPSEPVFPEYVLPEQVQQKVAPLQTKN